MPISNQFPQVIVNTESSLPLSIFSFTILTVPNESVNVVTAKSYRKGLTIFNSSTEIIYIDIEPDISINKFMFRLQPNDFYEMPYPAHPAALWAKSFSPNGNETLHVREICTPDLSS